MFENSKRKRDLVQNRPHQVYSEVTVLAVEYSNLFLPSLVLIARGRTQIIIEILYNIITTVSCCCYDERYSSYYYRVCALTREYCLRYFRTVLIDEQGISITAKGVLHSRGGCRARLSCDYLECNLTEIVPRAK